MGTRSGSKPGKEGIRPSETGPSKPERLQKILAHAGLGSRRECEEYILQGRVTVNGQVVRELGSKVEPKLAATIAVDGERIHIEKMVYYAVNKPKGYVSTNDDPAGRPRVIDILPELPERVYSVGRLDEDTTGLMILTNDGELANRLAHPRYGVEKTYRALVAGTPGREIVTKLTEGIWLSDGKVRAKRARVVGTQGEATILELVLAEGKKREIRRMLAKLGHKVMSLTRIAIGPVTLKGLPPGESRPLSRAEIDLLHKVASGIPVALPRIPQRGAGRPGAVVPKRAPARPSAEHGPRRRGHDKDGIGRHHDAAEREPRTGRPAPSTHLIKPPTKHTHGGGPRKEGPPDRPATHGARPPLPAPPRKQGGSPSASTPSGASQAEHRKRVAGEPRTGRKIIGLKPKILVESGASITGRPARKRPMIKKRPPRRASGIKRAKEEGDNG
jgi:23S rRNA pseudouridine2605 synthase